MLKAVVADLAAVFGQAGDEFGPIGRGGIETDHIDGGSDPMAIEQLDHPSGQDAEIAGPRHPIGIPMGAVPVGVESVHGPDHGIPRLE